MISSEVYNVYLELFSTEVELRISYKNPVTLICDRVLNYIGVQMALPFRKDKKSGVMKFNWRNCIPKKSSSRKSVVDSFKATTLQLGAGGEFI